MLIIGERLNSSIKKIGEMIRAKDSKNIQREAVAQTEAGAHVIDLNAGTELKSELDDITWLVQTVTEVVDTRFAIDSPNPDAISAGLKELEIIMKAKTAQGATQKRPIINSVTAEDDKLEAVLPLAKKYNAEVVGMCMDEHGIPDEPVKRCEMGKIILAKAQQYQIPVQDVYLDGLVMPVSTDTKRGLQALETIRMLKDIGPDVRTVIGLSNISYGLPVKPVINRAFVGMAMAIGLDAALLNPLDKKLMNMILVSDMILGNDEYCLKYIKAYRNGELE